MSITSNKHLSWVEIAEKALLHNTKSLRHIIGKQTILCPCVKGNAYGHGITETAKILAKSETDWFGVNSIEEAAAIRKTGVNKNIYIMGYVLKRNLAQAIELNCSLVIYDKETITELAEISKKSGFKAKVHLKIETGNNRQGIPLSEAVAFAKFVKSFHGIMLEGITTHFANIEDINHCEMAKQSFAETELVGETVGFPQNKSSYPKFQLENFKKAISDIEKNGISVPIRHCANSAATIFYPSTHFDMVRPGIATYGLWPSPEVKIASEKLGKQITLKPALTWKTRIAQIKNIPANSYVGYGCTYKTKKTTRIAVLPIGYYEGYDRSLSNKSHVLIRGEKAPVIGRICMNIMMADITLIPEAQVADTATLIGKDGKEKITAEYLAKLAGTINYEIVSRINDKLPRVEI